MCVLSASAPPGTPIRSSFAVDSTFARVAASTQRFGSSMAGAVREKKGLFQEANRGTVFLDEIGEMSSAMQVKLLRALQERVVRKVGGNEEEPVDVRIIAATNQNLAEKIQRGEFREDLYYRLNIIPIVLPPLRERREDIPLLVDHFLQSFTNGNGNGAAGNGHGTLVHRVAVRVEQAHRERLGAGGEGGVQRALHAGGIERHQHRAVGAEPLGDLEAVLALDDGLGPDERGHEQRGDVALGPADLDQVPEARGGQHGHPRAAPLEDRVGADGGAVDEPPHLPARDAERLEPGQDGRGLVPRPRRHLGDDHAAGALVHRGQVGERAPHVDADDEHAQMIASRLPRIIPA